MIVYEVIVKDYHWILKKKKNVYFKELENMINRLVAIKYNL